MNATEEQQAQSTEQTENKEQQGCRCGKCGNEPLNGRPNIADITIKVRENSAEIKLEGSSKACMIAVCTLIEGLAGSIDEHPLAVLDEVGNMIASKCARKAAKELLKDLLGDDEESN